ncbi:uromodulin-like [Ruditapes philippinarum]|uniref:uromodulin-like n=1 Tax=Ruditapes philippinarum TaxID=129788 RepID=UPI00295A6B50|nr:uromodulin-like [Ruditapes philippinarum]
MTNYCVDHRKCGTNDPIYLNGSLPSPEDGVVDATACVRTFEDCCKNSLNLKLKNCGFYMVYCFIEIETSCHSRFCFDVNLGVETTQTTQATSKQPDTDSGDDDDEKRRKHKDEANSTETGWIVTVVVLIVIILALLAVIIYICRR